MTRASDTERLRACIREAIPQNLFDNPVEPNLIYVPETHWKALDPGRALVIGDRGTGKTFWWEALASARGPSLLSLLSADTRAESAFDVRVAFGAKPVDAFTPPGKDTLIALFRERPARAVWKTFLMAQATPEVLAFSTLWSERVRWVTDNPEASDMALGALDRSLTKEGRQMLLLFDAIDSALVRWDDLVGIHRELFGLLLDLRALRSIRAKAFVRRDVMEDPAVMRFPDASKPRTAAVELQWSRADLYGLLWHYLANGSATSDSFRALRRGWRESLPGTWDVPRALREDERAQADLWHELAGEWMGANERKGDTWSWLINHLADAFGRVSPRSFLTAVRVAAERTPTSEAFPIHHTAIWEGVREASAIRAREIGEDFPWMKFAFEALEGLLVPCQVEAMLKEWVGVSLAARLDADDSARRRRSHGQDLRALVDELVALGVVQRLRDGRINVPDVYRLGFGMRRKGGVRPR